MRLTPESFTADGIAIARQRARRGDIDVDDLAPFMSEHEEHIEDSKGRRGHGEPQSSVCNQRVTKLYDYK